MYLVWCAKEALYKYYGLKALDFKNNLRVAPIDRIKENGSLIGYIDKDEYHSEVQMRYEFIEGYLVVYTL